MCNIVSGIPEAGNEIAFQPAGQKGLVERVEMFGKDLKRAEPDDSVGLVVDGIEEVGRGDVLSYSEDSVESVDQSVAEVVLHANLEVQDGDVLTIRLGTAKRKCEMRRLLEKVDAVNFALQQKSPPSLKNVDVGKIRFAALDSICLERYSDIPELGRFVVQGKKGIIGAGVVLEVR